MNFTKHVLNISKVVVLLLFVALSMATFAGCHNQQKDAGIDHYTCSMHPQIISDKPGECPICHMTLVPVYKEDHNNHSGSSHQENQDKRDDPATGMIGMTQKSGVNISVDKQDTAGVQTTTVQKMKAVFILRAFGTVAFDPDLAVVQSEYLASLNSAGELKTAAKNRLKLLGMSEAEIIELEKSQKVSTNLYLPDNRAGFWVYA
ncbi:MAG TPA: heavy metal-binding domain-containing protein, partial [bacterium]|nr:heavy metal-binding domain-containing protein [bacterium]